MQWPRASKFNVERIGVVTGRRPSCVTSCVHYDGFFINRLLSPKIEHKRYGLTKDYNTLATTLPTRTPNLMPFHVDYTGPANVSRFMKIEEVKPEELLEADKEPSRDGEVASGVDDVELTGDAPLDAPAPMETNAPENEGPTLLRRIWSCTTGP